MPFAGRLLKTEFPMARLVLVLALLPSTPPFARLLQSAVSMSAEGREAWFCLANDNMKLR
ncbi:hypothetical protein B0H11DRAFT_2217127 [Mycena galericulata]|nr:hypothetical protein B0H11DRAFT_2217127 [Mycena galericulata]